VRGRFLAAALAAAACAVPAAALGAAAKRIQVGDNYYGPTKVTVERGTTVKWVWVADNTSSHDVKLAKGPKGVKHFHSAKAATDYTFSRKLTRPGTYSIVCTLHRHMTMTIRVR
jgi:plastocyanin